MADHRYLSGNALVCGDNLDVLRQLPDECVDLIYLDPPFNSNQFYVAAFGDKGMVAQQLRDIWQWTVGTQNAYDALPHGQLRDTLHGIRLQAGDKSPMAAYAVFMGRRLAELRRVLKPKGSIYLHCDWHAVHYLKIMMDNLFGDARHQANITWKRATAHSDSQSWGATADIILFHGERINKDDVRVPLDPEYVAKFYRFTDERGPYQKGDLTAKGLSGGGYYYDYYGHSGPWRFPEERMHDLERLGRIAFPDKEKGVPRLKRYLSDNKGQVPSSVWTDIPPALSRTPYADNTKERLGYPTQKPLALLERVVKASSNPGDIVLDPFCGCGTAADAAASLGRKYLGIDISGIAVRVMQQRLESRGDAVAPVVYGLTWDEFEWEAFERRALAQRDEVEDGIPGWAWAEDRVAALLHAVPNQRKTGDGGVDARYFGAMDIEKHEGIVVPIQVKMYRTNPVGRPDMDRLLGTQTAMANRGLHAPMSIMVSLYPPPESLRVFAAEQGRVTLTTHEDGRAEYPRMQVLSVEEMLRHGERPKLPPPDPRSLVGDTQDAMLIL